MKNAALVATTSATNAATGSRLTGGPPPRSAHRTDGTHQARVDHARTHHPPDRAAGTDDQGRQAARAVHIAQRRGHAVGLIAQRLAAGKPKALSGPSPRRVAVRLLALDVDEPSPLPLAPVGFTQPSVEPGDQSDPGSDDLGGFPGPAQIRGPQRADPLGGDPLGQLTGLTTAGVV